MAKPDQPSCRLIVRLYNTRYQITRFTGATRIPGLGPSLEQRVSDAHELLRRARRVVAREGGVAIPGAFAPTPAGIAAALALATAALDEVAVRYRDRLE